MKTVYSSQILGIVAEMKNILELNGIAGVIANQYLATAAGELPPIECWPQLRVQEQDADRAEEIIRAAMADSGSGQPKWRCLKCNEELEPQFAQCWKCGNSRSESTSE
jgi:hypothetical protein